MGVHYRIDRERRLVVTTFLGDVGDEEFLELYRDIFADGRYELGMDEVADLRGATHFGISVSALEQVDQMQQRLYRGSGMRCRTAIVAPTDLSFGLARMYEAFAASGPESVSVFRSEDGALAWLGLDSAALDPAAEEDGGGRALAE